MASLSSSSGKDAREVPLLFLDIDGVLNRTATAPQINLEQDKVDRLRTVLEASGADVVLSTYWRAFDVAIFHRALLLSPCYRTVTNGHAMPLMIC